MYLLDYYGVDPNECTVTLMGFKVGKPAARMLYEREFRVIAVTDSQGGVYDENGLDIYDLMKAKESDGTVLGYLRKIRDSHPNAKSITNEAMLRLKKRSKDEKRISIPALLEEYMMWRRQ